MPFRTALSGLNAASADLRVTGNNIANANTPGYRAKDLKPLEFKEMVDGPDEQHVRINRTNKRHIYVEEIADYESQVNRDVSEITPNGNTVLLEQEMMKVAETQIQYELTTSLYKKNLGMLKTALGRR